MLLPVILTLHTVKRGLHKGGLLIKIATIKLNPALMRIVCPSIFRVRKIVHNGSVYKVWHFVT